MLLSGASIVNRGIVRNLLSATHQLQPCGVDLSLRRLFAWTSPATVDFDNWRRQAAQTAELRFGGDADALALAQGAYLVEFNEAVSIPLDCMGQVFTRSSPWRPGALQAAGVVDAGYEGPLGALLDVRNPRGIVVARNAKLGQLTLHRLEHKVPAYRGVYQFAASADGRDGPASSA